ncbi:MAG: hypothetical protein ACO1OD_05275 [Croceibacterium sp.]
MTGRANTPIALFVYDRPNHLARTLRSLVACEGFAHHPLTVFSDGPREPKDAGAVAAVRAVAREVLGSGADIREAQANNGLANSIVGGVGELISRHSRVIVVEDDFELAPCFLTYMTEALDRFEEAEEVFQVSGHIFDIPEFAGRREALFLPLTTTWGWATWARAWSAFDPDAKGSERLRTDPALRRRFNLDGTYDYAAMLERQRAGFIDSWGIRWYWSVFSRRGKVLFPPQSLVRNIGQDGSGTHGRGVLTKSAAGKLHSAVCPPALPKQVTVSLEDFAAARRAIWRTNGGFRRRVLDRFLTIKDAALGKRRVAV